MLWQCSIFMLQIQKQELQGQSVHCILPFLTGISLHKLEKVQDMQSSAKSICNYLRQQLRDAISRNNSPADNLECSCSSDAEGSEVQLLSLEKPLLFSNQKADGFKAPARAIVAIVGKPMTLLQGSLRKRALVLQGSHLSL